MYEKIKQNQLKLLQDTVNFENELTDRLAQLNIKHKEIETKIIKYDNIFNNVPLDANRMNQVKRKLKRSNRRFYEVIEELNKFSLDDMVSYFNMADMCRLYCQ